MTIPDAPLTDAEIAEMVARAEKATPGPWVQEQWASPRWRVHTGSDEHGIPEFIAETGFKTNAPANAAFIAAARTDVPRLAAELRRAERRAKLFEDGEQVALRRCVELGSELRRAREALEPIAWKNLSEHFSEQGMAELATQLLDIHKMLGREEEPAE